MSPAVGELDEDALHGALRDDAAAALPMLADLTVATDERFRAAARRLAAQLLIDRARVGRPRGRGVARLRSAPADRGGDIDLDRSIDPIVTARAGGRVAGLNELVAREWGRPQVAVCLLVDASGSMNGARLAAAALTAAACSWRAPAEFAVLSFARGVQVHRPLVSVTGPDVLVERLLALRGHGITGLANALARAGDELAAARAARRVVILLSDCRATDERDPAPAARALDELLVLAPADDCAEAVEFARRAGARCEVMADAADAPAALARLLDG